MQQRILLFGPPTCRHLLLIIGIFAYSISVTLSAPVSSSSAAVFSGGVEISDSYARAIVFTPVEEKKEEILTTTVPVEIEVQSTKKPDLVTTIKSVDENVTEKNEQSLNAKENEQSKSNISTENSNKDQKKTLDQEPASSDEKLKKENLTVYEVDLKALFEESASTTEKLVTESTTEKKDIVEKEKDLKLETNKNNETTSTNLLHTDNKMISSSTETVEKSSTIKPYEISLDSLFNENISSTNVSESSSTPNPETSSTTVTPPAENLDLMPTTETTLPKSTSVETKSESLESTTAATQVETSSKAQEMAETEFPEFITKKYYLDDSLTSTVIVTETVPTTKAEISSTSESSLTSSTSTSDHSILFNATTKVFESTTPTSNIETSTSTSNIETSTLQSTSKPDVETFPEFVTRKYYLDDSLTSTAKSIADSTDENLSMLKISRDDKSLIEEISTLSAASTTVQSTAISSTSKPEEITTLRAILDPETIQKENVEKNIPEFVTKTIYLDDSLTSTVIVTDTIPTTHSTTPSSAQTFKTEEQTPETKVITETIPTTQSTMSSTTQSFKTEEQTPETKVITEIISKTQSTTSSSTEILKTEEPTTETKLITEASTTSSWTDQSLTSTTEKIILNPGEVIILPSGEVLTAVEKLQEMLKSKTKDSDSEGSNVSPKLLEVPITHDHTNDHTISSTETTQSTILSSTESTTLPALSSSNVNNMEVQTLTEKSNQNEITTTERQVHQTVELKTSEVFNDDNSKTTSEKSLLEVKSEVQKPSTEDPLNKEAKNNEKMALEDPKDLLSTSEQFNEKNSTGTNVLKEESTTLGSVESTTKLNEIKESLTESSSLALDIISVTLTNALSSISETDKETTSTTINLSSESPLEVTRESKVFNETREATTLRWTTERNINWTLETSSVSSLTSLPTETSILTTTMPASDLVTLNSESDITTDVPKKDKTTTVSTKTNEEEEGVRKINLRPDSDNNDNKTSSITLIQELVSNEGLKSILNIKIMPVTDAPTSTTESSSSESDEELDVDVVTQHEEITTCESETCRKEAAKLLNKMNVEVDPCDDFYSYACGNFIKSTNFENGKNSITSIELFQRAIDEKLEKLLSSPIQNEDIDPYKIAKLLYGTCIKDLSHNSNNMNSFIEILENLGGIPIMKGTIWDSNRFNWLTLVQNLTKTGFYSSNLFDFTIQPSEKDFDFYGGKYIVKISPSNTILTKEKLNHLRNKEEIDRYKMYIAKVIRKLNNYLNYTAISKDISDIVAFEVQLVSLITKTEFESTDQLFTLKGLNSEFSFFNWSEIFSTYTSNINADDEILLANKKYLQGLENLINITDSRTLANYVLWRVVESSTLYLSKELQQIHDNYHLTQSYVTCSELVRKEIPLISSAMYSENYLNDNDNPELRNQVIEDVEGILDFTMGLLRWLDEESRVLAQKRLNETIRFITVPQELEKININSYFTELDYQNGSLLYQVLNVHKFNQMKEFQKLKTPVDKHEWTRFGDLLNILDYKPSERYILAIPATLIQEQLSDPTTSVIDYATIGLVIARDYIFRFMGLYDPVGTTYNSHGSWWSNESLNNFEPYMQCFVDKYSKFQTPDGIKLKSKHLRYENIVDVGALRAAHTAFKYLGDTVEERLPGIQYNEPRQIFWTRVAQNWCSKYTPDELKRVLLRGNEVPGKFRVNGALMQLRDFGKDFECKIGAPMYPDKNSCYGLWDTEKQF